MPDAPDQPLTPVSDLRNAFAASNSGPTQEETEPEQVQAKVEEPKTESRAATGTAPSRTESTKTREELLADLSLDELKAHPTLGRAIQSMVDTGVAAGLRGKTKEIEDRLRSEYELNSAKERFDSLDADELGTLLRTDPDARAAYVALQNRPTPTSANAQQEGQVQFLVNTVKFWNGQISQAGLPQETINKLNPENYLDRDGTAEEILQQWAGDIQKEITNFTVTKELAKSDKQREESEAANAAADQDSRKRGALITNGSKAGPAYDPMEGTWRTSLSNAWARREQTRK